MSERSERMKVALKRMVRLFTAWAWREEMERRYTVQEVTAWLAEYHGRYREIPMTLWIQIQRDKANASVRGGAAAPYPARGVGQEVTP